MDANILTVDEIGALVAATNLEDRAAVLMLAYVGLRVGELLGLSWHDLELNKRRARIERQMEGCTGELKSPKTRAGVRFVELPNVVVSALREHQVRTQKASPDRVFPYYAREFRSGRVLPCPPPRQAPPHPSPRPTPHRRIFDDRHRRRHRHRQPTTRTRQCGDHAEHVHPCVHASR